MWLSVVNSLLVVRGNFFVIFQVTIVVMSFLTKKVSAELAVKAVFAFIAELAV